MLNAVMEVSYTIDTESAQMLFLQYCKSSLMILSYYDKQEIKPRQTSNL